MTRFFIFSICAVAIVADARLHHKPLTSPARRLDAELQRLAFQACIPPRTGIVYTARIPPYLAGVAVRAMRLQSTRLLIRGLPRYEEFRIPTGVVVLPHVARVMLVYHNLGNSSEKFYPLPGFTYLAPLLGILVYDAANLSANGSLPELELLASGRPINVDFNNVLTTVTERTFLQCVWFDLDGVPQFSDLPGPVNTCMMHRRGHVSIVMNNTFSRLTVPRRGDGAEMVSSSKADHEWSWKLAVIVVVVVSCMLAAMVSSLICRRSKDRNKQEMEQHAAIGEALWTAPAERSATGGAPGCGSTDGPLNTLTF